jgi:hypothetical protein
MAAESKTVKREELTHYNKYLAELYKTKHDYDFSESEKLIPNLCDKIKYTCHMNNLKFYLS